MAKMRWLKAKFQYNGRPSVIGQEADVEARFVPILRQLKVAELLDSPKRVPPVPAIPPVVDPDAVAPEGGAMRPSLATQIAAGVGASGLTNPEAPVANPAETSPVAMDPEVTAAATGTVEGEDEKEKDVGDYNTRDMTTTKRRYTRRSAVDDSTPKA